MMKPPTFSIALSCRHGYRLSRQAGVMLLEALVALALFSIGLLGLVALQARALSLDQDARYRAEAAILANQVIGSMWAAEPDAMKSQFSTGGAAFNAWQSQVSAILPGVAANPPTIDWSRSTLQRPNLATVTISWKLPSAEVRTYTTSVEVMSKND